MAGSARTRKYALSLACIFRLGHFPRSKISLKSSFLIKWYIITVLIFFKAFWSVFEKVKKLIFHCIITNVILKWPNVLKKIDHGCFRDVGSYFIGQSPCTTYRLTFEFGAL